MADQRSVMKEFRSLDKKRSAGRLTPAEETRYALLRDLVGPEASAAPPQPGFDVDAAAAQLRDSLLPAGLRNRPPPAPVPPEPEAEAAEPSATDALEAVYDAEPFAPLEAPPQQDALFEPSSLSPEGAEPPYGGAAADEAQQPWDPNAPWEAGAASEGVNAAWDPNAPYDAAAQAHDPNAQAAWDPNAPYDPDAPEAAALGYEPGAQPYGEAAPADQGAAPWDAAQAQEPGASEEGAAYDADAPGAAAQAYDPNASPEAGAQGYPEAAEPLAEADLLAEPVAALEGAPADATELPPEGWFAEGAPGAAPGGAEVAPVGEDSDLESLLPFDPAAAAAITPGEMPEGFGGRVGEYDDTAGFDARLAEAAPADLPQEGADFQAAQSMEPEATPGLPPENVLEEGFELASGGSFDATAEAAAPEWAGGAPAPPWESAPVLEEVTATFAAPGAANAPPEVFDEAVGAGGPVPEDALGELGPLGADLAEQAELARQPAVAADDFSVEVDTGPEAFPPADAPALDFSQPDFSQGVSEEEAAFIGAAVAPASAAVAEASFEEPGGAGVPPMDLGAPAEPALEVESPAPAPETVEAAADEDIPTIDGEEILEEIPVEEVSAEPAAVLVPAPPAPPPPPAGRPSPAAIPPAPLAAAAPLPPSAAAPAAPVSAGPPRPARPAEPEGPPAPAASEAPAAPDYHLPGSHRVVVHTLEGQVKRGLLEDVDLDAGALGLVPQPGAAPEAVPSEKVKAIFFMLGPGEKAPVPEGKKVRVTFRDGRQVAGFSPDYREMGVGFFMIPADTRTNTGRIWVYRSAVRQVSVS